MRILQQVSRVYAEEGHFERQMRFYEDLQGVKCERLVKIRETGVEAAKIGGFLLFTGDKQHTDAIRHVNAIYTSTPLTTFSRGSKAKASKSFTVQKRSQAEEI